MATLGSNQQTITTGANFIPEVWMDEVRAYLAASLVLASKVKMFMFQGRKGDILHVPDVSELTVNTKSANTEVTLNGPTEDQFTLTIDQHKECSFLIEDMLAVQAAYDLRSEYTRSAGYAIAKKIDSDLWSLQSGLNNRSVSGSNGLWTTAKTAVGGAGNQVLHLNETAIRKSIETLDSADVPDDGNRFMCIHPKEKNALLAISRFTEYQMLGPGGMPIRTGQFGEIFGLPVYVTTAAKRVDTALTTLIMHRDAFALALQQSPRVQANYIPQHLGWLFTTDVIYGFAEFRDNHAVALFTPND